MTRRYSWEKRGPSGWAIFLALIVMFCVAIMAYLAWDTVYKYTDWATELNAAVFFLWLLAMSR